MTTYNTGNPVPSADPRDRYDNSQAFDEAVTGQELTFTDRLGVERKSWAGLEADTVQALSRLGYQVIGDYAAGLVVQNFGQVFRKDGEFYRAKAETTLPYPLNGDWAVDAPKFVSVGDAVLRQELSDPTSPSKGSAIVGRGVVSIASIADLLAMPEESRRADLRYVVASYHDDWAVKVPYRGPVGGGDFVYDASRSGVNDGGTVLNGFVRVSTGFVTPEMFGAVADGVTDDSVAILSALAASRTVKFSDGKYRSTQPIVFNGHTVTGAVSETFSQTGTIIVFDIPVTPSDPFAVRCISKKSSITNIKFIQKNWAVQLNGLRLDRTSDLHNCEFSYFNGVGALLASTDAEQRQSYLSTLYNLTCDYNAKTGIYIGGGANAILIINPRTRWNGSPSYGVQPTVAGNVDGIFTDGSGAFPGNGNTGEPQSVTIINPESAYNSRFGVNLQRFFDGTIVGGYGEFNLVGDFRAANIFGVVVDNFMSMQTPVFEVPSTDPLFPTRNNGDYPNRITIRGRKYGNGQPSTFFSQAFKEPMPAHVTTRGADGSVEFGPTSAGGVKATKFGGDSVFWDFGIVPVSANLFSFGDGGYNPVATGGLNAFTRAGNTEGSRYFQFTTAGQSGEFSVANGGGANTAQTFLRAPKNSVTNRSINAGGTINASGADYAEYESNNGLRIAKGQVVGFKADGTLTLTYDESVRFGIKSTDPAIVGGDTWFVTDLATDASDEDEKAHQQALDEARAGVDRIAYCGKVPCNFDGECGSGDFLVPVKGQDGGIGLTAVSKPSLEQLYHCIGVVNRRLSGKQVEVVVRP